MKTCCLLVLVGGLLYLLFDFSVNFLPLRFFALFLKYIVDGQTSWRSDANYSKLEAIVIKFVILVLFIKNLVNSRPLFFLKKLTYSALQSLWYAATSFHWPWKCQTRLSIRRRCQRSFTSLLFIPVNIILYKLRWKKTKENRIIAINKGTKLIRQLADDSGLRSEQTFQTCEKFQIVKILS